MKIYLLCCGIVLAYLGISYIWGRNFLSLIRAKVDLSSSILFGFIILLTSYQIPYMPFFLLRGSYKTLSLAWLAVISLITIYLLFRLIKAKTIVLVKADRLQIISIGIVSALFIYLCVFISMHSPAYGSDIDAYIDSMNAMCYNDSIWIQEGYLNIHHGMNSIFGMMTIPSLILGIRPYYMSLFTMRILLVLLSGMAVYRIGKSALKEEIENISLSALWMSAIVSVIIMFWNSDYQAHFFFRRSNEAKAYCQFVLYPLGFSVFLQMCTEKTERKGLWIQQFFVGLSAVAISMSSLTGYPFLVLMGMMAVLAYDKFRKPVKTILWSLLCVAPNLMYILLYLLDKNGQIVL